MELFGWGKQVVALGEALENVSSGKNGEEPDEQVG